MNIRLFNKDYWLRRFGEQREVKGYLTAGYQDYVVSLNVHPMGSDALQALPEGERSVKHLEAHGDYDLVVANKGANQKGDLLYYHGNWYECTASQLFDHTVLSHYNYQFVQVPLESRGDYDIANAPTGDPKEQEGAVRL